MVVSRIASQERKPTPFGVGGKSLTLIGKYSQGRLYRDKCRSNQNPANKLVLTMGKFAIADAEIARIWICKKCKGRNKAGAKRCRRCGYGVLRPKNKEIKAKK